MATTSTNRLAKLRRMQRLTLEDIGLELGVSASTVLRWERGEVQIPDRHKLTLSDLFGVSVVFLMGWEDNGANDGDGVKAVA